MNVWRLEMNIRRSAVTYSYMCGRQISMHIILLKLKLSEAHCDAYKSRKTNTMNSFTSGLQFDLFEFRKVGFQSPKSPHSSGLLGCTLVLITDVIGSRM